MQRLWTAIFFTFFIAFAAPAHAVLHLATSDYAHQYLTQVWGISLPRPENIDTDMNLISMKYLMKLVDDANFKLNGFALSDYSNDPKYSQNAISSSEFAKYAVDELILKSEYKFFFTPATTNSTYSFQISAAGDYVIDWGDGNIKPIHKTTIGLETFSHTYDDAASGHEIKLGGRATKYSSSNTIPAISFSTTSSYIKSMRGCLGCIFSTIDDESVAENARQPRFYETFRNNKSLQTIPGTLFSGVTGKPVPYMFYYTFHTCSMLQKIPDNLFGGIQGAPVEAVFNNTFAGCVSLSAIPATLFQGLQGSPAPYMFNSTFNGCSSIKTLPEGLFSGIKGAPAPNMFSGTFRDCSSITSAIPSALFGELDGAPADKMFESTFNKCSGLSGEIPSNLFSGIHTEGISYKDRMFGETFSNCGKLRGNSAKIGDLYLYQIWTPTSSQGTYTNTYFDDSADIPTVWK